MFGLTDEQIKYIRVMNNGKVPVDSVFNVYNDKRLWANIPGFNGYQLSDDYIIRSYKYRSKFPYGVLIFPVRKGKKSALDDVYELSDNDNMRRQMTAFELGKLVHEQPSSPMNLYHTAYIIPVTKSSRNQRLWINQDPSLTSQKQGLVKKSAPLNKKETTSMAKFTVTDNPEPLIKGDI